MINFCTNKDLYYFLSYNALTLFDSRDGNLGKLEGLIVHPDFAVHPTTMQMCDKPLLCAVGQSGSRLTRTCYSTADQDFAKQMRMRQEWLLQSQIPATLFLYICKLHYHYSPSQSL
jgi:hypothetical protein